MDIRVIASSSRGNCTVVSDGHRSLLLDAGIPYVEISKALNFDLSRVAGALITHEHKDHCKATIDLSRRGITIYGSKGTLAAVEAREYRKHILAPCLSHLIDSFNVYPFDVQHDAAEPYGYVVTSIVTGERLIYFTDTYYLKYRFPGLNYILGEVNYDKDLLKENIKNGVVPNEMAKRLMKAHMSLETFVEYLKANDRSALMAVYLLHMSDTNGDAEKAKKRIQEITGVPVYIGGN